MSSKEEMKPERRGVQSAILTNNELYEPKNDFWSKDLDNQYFKGPKEGRGAYASVCVLNPILTIEHRDREYHIAVNFHLETTILGYSTQKNNDNEWFFSDVTLQYLSKFGKEKLVTEPASDPTSAFAVTRSSHTTVNGNVGVTASQVPSANVSLGITRSRDLSVEYKMKTWSVSAHEVAQPADASLRDRPRSVIEYFRGKIGGNDHSLDRLGSGYRYISWQEPQSPTNLKCPRYQWFWVGNQEETEVLTPDLRHTVKRHIVMKRVIKDADFPVNGVDRSSEIRDVGARRYQKSSATLGNGYQQQTLKELLDFSFRVQIRVMKKHGRLHRFFTISNNKVKGSILTPYYVQGFHIGVRVKSIPDGDIPPQGPNDTESIPATLAEIKKNNSGDYDKLHGQNLKQIKKRQIEQAQSAHRPTYTRVARKYLSIETLRELRIDYTLDTDPDYILIKRWIPEYEQDILWNHTRELRELRRGKYKEFEAVQKHERVDRYRGIPRRDIYRT